MAIRHCFPPQHNPWWVEDRTSPSPPFPPSSYPSQPYLPNPPQPQHQPQYRNSYYPSDAAAPLEPSFASMSISQQQNYPPRPVSAYAPVTTSPPPPGQPRASLQHQHARNASGPRPPSPRQQPTSGPPSLTVPLPTIPNLTAALPAIQRPDRDPSQAVAWVRDVLSLVERAHQLHASSANAPSYARCSVTRAAAP